MTVTATQDVIIHAAGKTSEIKAGEAITCRDTGTLKKLKALDAVCEVTAPTPAPALQAELKPAAGKAIAAGQ